MVGQQLHLFVGPFYGRAPRLGFGMVNGRRDREYRAGLSTGDRDFSLGVSMGWGSVRHVVLGGNLAARATPLSRRHLHFDLCK